MSQNKLSEFLFETVTIDEEGQINSRTSASAQYFTEDLGESVTLDIIAIPAGNFVMGARGKNHNSDESPPHEVHVPAFGLSKYSITQAQYQAVMGKKPSMFSGENLPVERVNWHDAREFCQKLAIMTGKQYRLPSEAEWEYACKAGSTTTFFLGDMITSKFANFHGEVAWNNGPGGVFRGQTTEVGMFPPNKFGLYDMHGNVFDWCEDIYEANYRDAPNNGIAWEIQDGEELRVLRGGSWYHTPIACASTTRLRIQPNYRAPDIGIRVAISDF